jgi:subtilisin-like proprotein convertase family protein
VTGFTDGGWIGVRGTREPVTVTAWSDEPVPVQLCRGPAPYFDEPACAVRTPPGGAVVVEVSGLSTVRGETFVLQANPFVFSSDPPQAIPDGLGAAAVSTVALEGLGASPGELALLLEVVHPAVNELSVMLAPPGGGTIYSVVYAPSGGANLASTVLAPSGETYIGAGIAPYASVFHPAVTLPGAANGTWTLTVRDQAPGNAGLLVRWGIAVR